MDCPWWGGRPVSGCEGSCSRDELTFGIGVRGVSPAVFAVPPVASVVEGVDASPGKLAGARSGVIMVPSGRPLAGGAIGVAARSPVRSPAAQSVEAIRVSM